MTLNKHKTVFINNEHVDKKKNKLTFKNCIPTLFFNFTTPYHAIEF